MSQHFHAPVLAVETLNLLPRGGRILDCTLGGGGHTLALLQRGDQVVALDQDPEAIAFATERLSSFLASGQLRIVTSNFADIAGNPGVAVLPFDGILLDLGVSSHQLDSEKRGFTFRPDAPLDMRMDNRTPGTAADLLNSATVGELQRILREYADEPRAARVAAQIVRRRGIKPFQSADDLVNAIRGALGPRCGPSDFARIFQGFRIAVNNELDALQKALTSLKGLLKPSGVMIVISYHSGEDRIVKTAFRDWSRACVCPPLQPYCTCGGVAEGTVLTRKAVTAGEAEVQANVRARSARLRGWQRRG